MLFRSLFALVCFGLVACGTNSDDDGAVSLDTQKTARVESLSRSTLDAMLTRPPGQQIGFGRFDWFGKNVSFFDVLLNPRIDPDAVFPVNEFRREQGRIVFFQEEIGDDFGLQKVLGLADGFRAVVPEIVIAIAALKGEPTSNLEIELLRDLTVGDRTLRKGDRLSTGLDVEPGGILPIGLRLDLNITCAICHAAVDESTGELLSGVPNGDLNIPAFIALAPNTAAALGRLSVDIEDPALYDGTGKRVIDSDGNVVELPNPQLLELATDRVVAAVPPGHFESAIDRVTNTTQIPPVWTRGVGPYAFEGSGAVGPFAGLTSLNNAVHSSEINILAVPFNGELLDIDREVYLGVLLQNAADPAFRLPAGDPVVPSEFLRQLIPDPRDGELEDQVVGPSSGDYPNLLPTLFTYNGLLWSPDTGEFDLGSGRFLEAANAMSVYQNSLDPPPNKTSANRAALIDGKVDAGAQVFVAAGCDVCHPAPFYTDNQVHPNSLIQANPARADSRRPADGFLSPPQLYGFNERVPIRPDAKVIDVPFDGVTDDPSRLPFVARDGGYKTLTLRGLHVTAPYLHDGGVAVSSDALSIQSDGSFSVVDPSGLGLPGTNYSGRPADPANSLRALLDSTLRAQVVRVNQALVPPGQNLEGRGHNFWVDRTTGFSSTEQADLIAFLLALDDDPAVY
ncbi:MAG: hypothetical protein AAFV36_03465 [Myxococcota bacterium]